MKANKPARWAQGLAALALACCALASSASHAAATITIVNANEPGVGFNDPTPALPVGGNTGTTLGQQRLIAFQYAANIWGARLTSDVAVRVDAAFEPLDCDATGAVLGAAGAYEIYADFLNAPRARTWYPSALASKLAGFDVTLGRVPHIFARFNSRLGLFDDCLPGSGFYLGLDRQFGTGIDLVTVLLHEMAHGLGFQTFTDDFSGTQLFGLPSIWDYYLVDNRLNRSWVSLNPAQRAASAVSGNGLSWSGPRVTAAVPAVLAPSSNLNISGEAAGSAARNYAVGDAAFGPPLGTTAVVGQLMPVVDQAFDTGLACTPLSPANAQAVRGNIALVDRGACGFAVKARVVQAAGAIGMIVADNFEGELTGMSGTDPLVTIPSVRITLADGIALRAALQGRSRTRSGVIASLGVDSTRLAGADASRRVLLYTPSFYAPGSTVSHYTTAAKPNQLMEPAINTDLTQAVQPPGDLTLPLLQDIGW
ncbi:PA domain-containing protein [Massilia sp. S19_KUP03_FR1]|uniref:PA domain-containing protein n=1 Tax=Massilia sp. S19_KUP03_FR1 TaxID=3025503 RepID=UPI002FCD6C4A